MAEGISKEQFRALVESHRQFLIHLCAVVANMPDPVEEVRSIFYPIYNIIYIITL